MSFLCCGGSSKTLRVVEEIREIVLGELRDVLGKIGQTDVIMIISPEGEAILLEDLRGGEGGKQRKSSGGSSRKGNSIRRAESAYGLLSEDKFLGIVASLKKATSLFAASLNVPESHKIHVKGSTTLFSYYKLGASGSILAAYTSIGPHTCSTNIEDMDADMRPVRDKLETILARMLL